MINYTVDKYYKDENDSLENCLLKDGDCGQHCK